MPGNKFLIFLKRENLSVLIIGLTVICIALLNSGCDWKSEVHADIDARAKQGKIITDINYRGATGKLEGHAETAGIVSLIGEVSFVENGERKVITKEVTASVVYCTNYKLEIDPVLLQVPSDWYDFSGTYTSPSGSGYLVISEGSFASDKAGTLYVPESGHKLIMVSAPSATADDTYTIELRWKFSQYGTKTVKGIFVGHVWTQHSISGETHEWFPPIVPETTNFSEVSGTPFVWTFMVSPVPANSTLAFIILGVAGSIILFAGNRRRRKQIH